MEYGRRIACAHVRAGADSPKPERPCPTCATYGLENVTLSPDGRWVAATLWGDHTIIKVWDVASGRVRSHSLPVPSILYRASHNLAFSADGRWLVSDNYDAKINDWIRVWEIGSGKLLKSFVLTRLPTLFQSVLVPHLPFLPMLVGSQPLSGVRIPKRQIRTRQRIQSHFSTRQSGKLVRTLQTNGINNHPFAMSFSPDGRSLVVGVYDSPAVNVWDPGTGQLIRTLEGNPGATWSVGLLA